MNFIRRMLKPNTLPHLPHLHHLPQLGRWNLNYDPKIVHSKPMKTTAGVVINSRFRN